MTRFFQVKHFDLRDFFMSFTDLNSALNPDPFFFQFKKDSIRNAAFPWGYIHSKQVYTPLFFLNCMPTSSQWPT